MRRGLTFLLLAVAAAPLGGQTVTYIKSYDMNNYVPPNVSVESFIGIESVADGYYLTGVFVEVISLLPLSAETASVVLKTDKDGEIVLGTTYKVTGVFLTDVKSASGNYLLSGFTGGVDTSGVVMEMDLAGNVQWAKVLNISADNRDKVIEGLPLSSGEYVFVGESVNSSTGFDAIIFKTDATGNLMWYKFLGGNSPYGDKARDVAELPSGDVAVVGIAGGFVGNYAGFLAVLDGTNGNIVWHKVYGTPSDEYLFEVEPTSDGGFVMVGDRMVGSDTNVLVIKTDGSGNVQWAYEYGGSTTKELGRGVVEVADGYVISGTQESSVLLFKINTSGDVVWAKTYSSIGADAGSELVHGVDGGFAVVGVWSIGVSQDGVVVKTLDDGRVLASGGGNCSSQSDIILPRSAVSLTVQTPPFTLSRTLALDPYSPTVSPTVLASGEECPLGGEFGLPVAEVGNDLTGDYEIFTVDGRRVEDMRRGGIYILKGKGGCRKVIFR